MIDEATLTLYLNHAGTSWPKPPSVMEATAAVTAMHPRDWPELFRSAHQAIAEFFHVDTSRFLLTPGCTAALALAVADFPWEDGDRVLTSRYEHHALHRPLVKLLDRGVDVTLLPSDGKLLVDLEVLETELKSGRVRMVAVTAACNVTGQLLPIADVIQLAHEHGAVVLIDGAQIAGWWDLDLVGLGADLFTWAGHKGPQAPWGIGGLYVAPQVSLRCPRASCDISDAERSTPFATLPGFCDTGSVNLGALAGMAAACRWLSETASATRLQDARQQTRELTEAIRDVPHIKIHGDVSIEEKMPTVAITVGDCSATQLAQRLRADGLIASGGYQCAPQAHQALGTDQTGVVRFSFGPDPSVDVRGVVGKLTRTLSRP